MSDQDLPPSGLPGHPAQPRRPVHPLEQPPPPVPPAQQPLIITHRPRVEVPFSRPVLTYILLGINIVVFLVDALTAFIGVGAGSVGLLTLVGAKVNAAILQGQYWRLITPMFLHVGILHLGFNSYFLYRIGPWAERNLGTARFAAIYFLSGVAAAIASFALNSQPSVGASGALFGVIGAMLPVLYRNRSVLANTRQMINSIVMTIAINLVIGFSPGIDNWAHIGGLLAGVALALLISPRFAVRERSFDLIRIVDESSPLLVWLSVALFAMGLTAIMLLLVTFARS